MSDRAASERDATLDVRAPLEAEVQRLRAALEAECAASEQAQPHVEALRAEVERLKALADGRQASLVAQSRVLHEQGGEVQRQRNVIAGLVTEVASAAAALRQPKVFPADIHLAISRLETAIAAATKEETKPAPAKPCATCGGTKLVCSKCERIVAGHHFGQACDSDAPCPDCAEVSK